MNEKPKRSVPTYMKVVIAALSLFLGLVVGLLIVGGGMIFKASDPNYKKNVADSIAEFSDPLPSGFNFGAATDLNNVKTILINHTPARMDVAVSAADVTDESMKKALITSFQTMDDPAFFEGVTSGKMTIAGHVFEYHEGVHTMGKDKLATLDGMITDIPGKFISIKAYAKADEKFDLKTFQTLANSIKSLVTDKHRQ